MIKLDSKHLIIEQQPNNLVHMKYLNTSYINVSFVQLFPHTNPRQYILARIKSGDMYTDIGIIENLDTLPILQQECIMQDLHLRYFVPQIMSIASITRKRGTQTWITKTDRGDKTFLVKDPGENITTGDTGIVIITDTEKCRYKISGYQSLDQKSRRFLEKMVIS